MITKEKTMSQDRNKSRLGTPDDALGPNTDIGLKLRALYGSVQDEGIPDKLLDLLEKLDQVEQQAKGKAASRGE
jgi:hypothetical protein